MNRETIEKRVYVAIKQASGKSASEAVGIISDAVELLVTEASAEDVFFVAPGPENPPDEIPSAIVRTSDAGVIPESRERLQELAPITGTKRSSSSDTYREYHSIADLQDMVAQSSPEVIEVMPSGYAEPLQLRRIITNMALKPEGIQLAYKVAGADSGVAFPKAFFWITDEVIDIETALGKMKSDALLMYARRTKPVESRPVVMAPLETRMKSAGTVVWDGK